MTLLRAAVPPDVGADPDPEVVDDAGPVWVPTRALGRAVLLTGLLLLGAVLLGRVDLVVLAAPFALGTAVALRRRPSTTPEIRLETAEEFTVEGDAVAGSVVVSNPDAVGYDLVVARLLRSPWLRVRRGVAGDAEPEGATPQRPGAAVAPQRPGAAVTPDDDADQPFAASAPAGTDADLPLRATALRWGRHALGPAAARAVACGGLLASRPVLVEARELRVYPLTEPFKAVEAMPRAAGLVGGHRSRRPGEGGELAGVRGFTPGDRLRRIDWRVTLRARHLHVAATLSDRDAEVVLLVDVLTEAGRSGGIRGPASVLDTTVRAAAAIAEHYLHRGDRVSLVEYGPGGRRLRPASGRRQYLTVLEWLLDVRAADVAYDPSAHVFGGQLLSSNALLVVLTPLVDARSAAMLAQVARSGRFVVAVDTLPDTVRPAQNGPWTDVAYRLWRLDRENTVGQLREHGVPVVAWAGAGSLDLVLRDVARLASAPRAGAR